MIDLASWAGRHATAPADSPYNAAKRAVVALTETIDIQGGTDDIRACAIRVAEVAASIAGRRPVASPLEKRAKMAQPQYLGRAMRWVAELPAHACVNEILFSPTSNRIYVGGPDIQRSAAR